MSAVGLLGLSPELQRNLWLELTPTRLVAAPLVLLVLLGGMGSVFGAEVAARAAVPLLWALLSLWGSRLAAESFGEETTGRTWDVQRLSVQSAWGLALSKLIGGTVFVWYGALISAAILLMLGAENVGEMLGAAALAGLTAQSTALFTVLLLHRFDERAPRAHTTLAQIVGIIAGWNSQVLALPAQIRTMAGVHTIDWYGFEFPADSFFTVLQIAAIPWLVFGAMRLIRRELGFQDGPLGWTLYTLYTLAVVGGFMSDALGSQLATGSLAKLPVIALGVQSLLGVAAFALTYLAAFGTPVSRISLIKLRAAAGARDWRAVWRNLPVWVPSAVAAAIVAIFLSARLASSAFLEASAATPIAALGFLSRDLGPIMCLRLAYRRRTAVTLLVIFLFLYALLPALLVRPGGGALLPLFFPGRGASPTGILLPWLEASAVWFFAWRRSASRAVAAAY
jgi:hypothetical protein